MLCPQAGGRVLEFSVEGNDALYFEEAEKNWRPGKPGPITAGRIDYGPELTVTPHPKAWSGEWTAEITRTNSVKLTSPREDAGIQVTREFRLVPHDKSVGLSCRQTMVNVSKEIREVCHWGRSFSPGGGDLRDPARRPPQSVPGVNAARKGRSRAGRNGRCTTGSFGYGAFRATGKDTGRRTRSASGHGTME